MLDGALDKWKQANTEALQAPKCIYREFLGGNEMLNFDDLEFWVVQDQDEAFRIANDLLCIKDGSDYLINTDAEPQFIERLTLTNRDALIEQIKAVKEREDEN